MDVAIGLAIGFGFGVALTICVALAGHRPAYPELPAPPPYMSSHSVARFRLWLTEFESAWRRSAEEFERSDPEKARNAKIRQDTIRLAAEAFDRITLGML